MNLNDALHRLPHGPEFRFITRITALDPGKSGSAVYELLPDDPFLRGHFPGDPLMPGVLLLEACAQLAGVVAQSDPAMAPLPGLKLTALQHVKILGAARPGQTLELFAQISGRLGGLVQAEVRASVGTQELLRGRVTLSGGVA